MRLTGLLLVVCALGCPKAPEKSDESKSTTKAAATGEEKKAAPDDEPEAKSEKKKAKKAEDKGRKIAGVVVPAWSKEEPHPEKCKPTAEQQKTIDRLMKGDDDAVTDGTIDLEKLTTDVVGSCAAMKPRLAMSLNSGGFMKYSKKKYDEADRWWARALVIDPALTVARYNLASGLALEGKTADAIWALQELARAADDGDAAASNYLDKAKTDKDLDSLRDDKGFKEAVSHAQGGLVGPRKEPELAAQLPALLPKEWREDTIDDGVGNEVKVAYKPTLVDVWTWRPNESTELLVGRVAMNPAAVAKIANPEKGGGVDANAWGGIVVMKLEGKKPKVLLARKTGGNAPQAIAAGKQGTVIYTFMWGPLGGAPTNGSLQHSDGKVTATDPQE